MSEIQFFLDCRVRIRTSLLAGVVTKFGSRFVDVKLGETGEVIAVSKSNIWPLFNVYITNTLYKH